MECHCRYPVQNYCEFCIAEVNFGVHVEVPGMRDSENSLKKIRYVLTLYLW